MQRQIKFRGKAVKSGKWLYGDLIHNRDEVYIADDSIITAADIQGHTDFEVNPDTIGQFTGMTDRNDKEIYEGDIVQWQWEADHPRSEPMEVVAKFGAFGYMYCDDFHSFVGNTNFTFCELGTDKRVEIVGNIHDNPELLKGGNHAD